LGFDILLDEIARPWLLEVNHAPSFATDSPLDHAIKYDLIHDTLLIINDWDAMRVPKPRQMSMIQRQFSKPFGDGPMSSGKI
jgi:hypothetical protein